MVFDLSDVSSFHKATEFFSAAYENEIHTKLLIGNKAVSSLVEQFFVTASGHSVHSFSVSFPFRLSVENC